MKTKQLFLTVSVMLLLVTSSLQAQIPTLVWVKQFGEKDNNSSEGKSITTDANENVYTVGRFSDTVDFDPGSGFIKLISAGQSDIFIQKLDANAT